jgi:hypothetical protein
MRLAGVLILGLTLAATSWAQTKQNVDGATGPPITSRTGKVLYVGARRKVKQVHLTRREIFKQLARP